MTPPPYLHAPAHPALRAVVRGFSQRRFAQAQAPALCLPARTDSFIEFYLAEPYRVRHVDEASPEPILVPEMTLVAPHTRPGTQLFIRGRVDTFTVHFTPTGCHRLFGCDQQPLRDQGSPAAEVLGRGLATLQAALARQVDWPGRLAAAQAWLGERLLRARPADALDAAAEALAEGGPPWRLAELAARAGCSERHLSRVLSQRLGVSPRLYARMARFEAVLQAHQQQPAWPIAQLAQAAHYFDQAHLVRDCREFTGEAPGRYFRHWTPRERAGL